MEARDVRPTYRDGDPPTRVQGVDPVGKPSEDAELQGLLEKAIRHLESSDLRSASAELERACNRVASLWSADESPGLVGSRTPHIRHVDAGPESGGSSSARRRTRARET